MKKMNQECNPLLMKITRINDHLKEALNTEKFYATPLNQLNDPIEQIRLVALTTSNKDEAFDANYKNNCGIYCVTEFSNKHFSGPILPMWAHYGDNHKGVCLVIRPKRSKQSDWIKVKYINSTNIQTIDTAGKSQFQVAKDVLSFKLKPWSTENEHRLVFPPEKTGQTHDWSDFFELKQIIFGYKCTPRKINELLSHFSDNLRERVGLEHDDENFLDLRQVREPWSVISDLAPLRVILSRDACRISGHCDTYPENGNQFYPLGELNKGQIPVCRIP
jgi:Protein of unknown function (DUF2971)